MYEFHVTVHPRGAKDPARAALQVRGESIPTLLVSAAGGPGHFAVTFEQACEALQALERMFVEPDGSLLWSGQHDKARWQLEGVLYDEADKLLYAELWGRCPPAHFDQLLRAFGWPQTECIFCLVREGVWLDATSFRHYAFHSVIPPAIQS